MVWISYPEAGVGTEVMVCLIGIRWCFFLASGAGRIARVSRIMNCFTRWRTECGGIQMSCAFKDINYVIMATITVKPMSISADHLITLVNAIVFRLEHLPLQSSDDLYRKQKRCVKIMSKLSRLKDICLLWFATQGGGIQFRLLIE